tara:strand:- start:8444 stop:8626 length:183 start_codon:yes stop_codon:yes gene_type:complete
MCYYGAGGFTFSDVYDMPVYLRNFYYQELVDIKKSESDNIKKSQQKSNSSKPPMNPRFKR